MANITEKSILPGSLENRWQQCLDPANLMDSFASFYGFYYDSLPISFEDVSELSFEISRWMIGQEWKLSVDVREDIHQIILTQLHGPFKRWRYIIKLEKHDDEQTLLVESLSYKMKFSVLGGLVDDLFLKAELREQIRSRQESLVNKI